MADRKMNPQVDAFIDGAKKWRAEMEKLRAIVRGCAVTEELKWGKPCYTFAGHNVVIIQGFKEYCALLFCKGALLKDPRKILIQQTENVQAARQLRFTDVAEIVKLERSIKAYVKEAIEVEKAGAEVEYKKTSEFSIPAELENKFVEDPAFKKAFTALTPGRQRGYLLHFSGAKQAQTRTARIEKCAPQILKGKGLHDWEPEDKGTDGRTPSTRTRKSNEGEVVLLSGGNPQIAKGDGDAPVQAYIAAMPGWKSGLGKRLDALIVRIVPKVQKAVRWNSPFYGVEGQGWFLSFHVLTRYVKVTFFAGASLKPAPPGSTPKSGQARWIDIHEDDEFDEKQMTAWIKQAAALPGWAP